ncbi:hypothetical protein GC098_11325 [Paenibacillus sp. LMG 31458]|uniref:Uncharacterized protein n=1 Tax=Paenibacillus phytorum TaxID=2654977 RepID=A0ABX1XU26_9BACL|nr:hypothetical protein [Paenibacillus phytorum]
MAEVQDSFCPQISMLRIAYYLLTRKEMYVDLGEDYFEKQKLRAIVRNSVRRQLKMNSLRTMPFEIVQHQIRKKSSPSIFRQCCATP